MNSYGPPTGGGMGYDTEVDIYGRGVDTMPVATQTRGSRGSSRSPTRTPGTELKMTPSSRPGKLIPDRGLERFADQHSWVAGNAPVMYGQPGYDMQSRPF